MAVRPIRQGKQANGLGGSNFVVVSTADWDAVLWTNKQHTSIALRNLGHRVLYVESMGLRNASFGRADATRILSRLSRLFRAPKEVERNIWRWSPPSIPLQRYKIVRLLNKVLCTSLLRFWTGRLFGSSFITWTFSPLHTELVDLSSQQLLVYHCVDDIAAQPGMPQELIQVAEKKLIEQADLVFVTSYELKDRVELFRPASYYPNCVDYTHFSRLSTKSKSILDQIPKPRIGFVGALADYKLDVELLRAVFNNRPDWSLVLAGPFDDKSSDVKELIGLRNVFHLGKIKYSDLPAHLNGLDVGIIPSRINRYTKSMFPMKFFEYLAAGLPVVATELDSLRDFSHVAELSDRGGFEDAIQRVLYGEVPSIEARRREAQKNTYDERTRAMLSEMGVIVQASEGNGP